MFPATTVFLAPSSGYCQEQNAEFNGLAPVLYLFISDPSVKSFFMENMNTKSTFVQAIDCTGQTMVKYRA